MSAATTAAAAPALVARSLGHEELLSLFDSEPRTALETELMRRVGLLVEEVAELEDEAEAFKHYLTEAVAEAEDVEYIWDDLSLWQLADRLVAKVKP